VGVQTAGIRWYTASTATQQLAATDLCGVAVVVILRPLLRRCRRRSWGRRELTREVAVTLGGTHRSTDAAPGSATRRGDSARTAASPKLTTVVHDGTSTCETKHEIHAEPGAAGWSSTRSPTCRGKPSAPSKAGKSCMVGSGVAAKAVSCAGRQATAPTHHTPPVHRAVSEALRSWCGLARGVDRMP
jgi:hypothetical protein